MGMNRRALKLAHATQPTTTSPGRLVVPALSLGSFITTLMFAAPAPFLTDIARDLDVGVSLVGQVTAAMLILAAPLGLVTGPIADVYGARHLIVLGLCGTTACLLIFGFAPIFPVLFVASIAGAWSEATVPGLSLAIAGTRFAGPASRRAIGWIVGALASAPIVGVPLLTTIGGIAGWRAAFLAAGGTAVVIVVLVAVWLPDDRRRPEDRLRLKTLLNAYRPLLHHTAMRGLYACTVLRSLSWLGLLTYFGALLRDRFALSTSAVGWVYMLAGAGYLLGSLLAGGPLARLPARPVVAISNVTMGLLMAVAFAAVLDTRLTIALLPVAAFAGAVGWVGLTALLARDTPAGAGTTMVLNGSLFNLGAAAGAGLGGMLLGVGGYTAVAVGLPLFALGSALCLVIRRSPLAPMPVASVEPWP
jgi:predicted MFS family arabinose efflux permease